MKEDKIQVLVEELLKIFPLIRRDIMHASRNQEIKLSPHEHISLNIIARHSPISMTELSRALGVSNQQMTRIVDALVEMHLVERLTSPDNRRLVLAQLTDKGKQALEYIKNLKKQHLSNKLTVLSEEEIEQCIHYLTELNKIMAKLK